MVKKIHILVTIDGYSQRCKTCTMLFLIGSISNIYLNRTRGGEHLQNFLNKTLIENSSMQRVK